MSVETISPLERGADVWRTPRLVALAISVVGALSLWLFWDGLTTMWGYWMDTPEYSHAILIPVVAAFLIWQQKDHLERVPFDGSAWGILLVLLGGGLLVLGQLGTIYVFVQFAYVVTLAGLVLSFTGRQAFKLLAVPLLILLFMIPLPQFVLNDLSLQLQLLSSKLGVWLIRLFDISVFLDGNVIDLGNYKLQVADACSGLRYLFPLMTLGFLMAYFYKGALWKRVFLFLSSIPITLAMNSVRVGVIGLTVDRSGIGMAEGFLHEFQGWAVFMVCTFLLLGEIVVLNQIGREAGTWRQLFGVEFPAATPAGAVVRKRQVPLTFFVASGLLVIFIILAFAVPRPSEASPDRESFSEFPVHLDHWEGKRDTLEGIFLDTLKLDDYLLADYSNGLGQSVNLYVAYYNSQRKGDAVHSPRSCLPGGGWQMRKFEQRELPSATRNAQPLVVNRVLIQQGDQRQLMYYWFQQRGRVIDSEYAVKWYLFWDSLTRHRTDGALVRLISPLSTTVSEADAELRMTELIQQIVPILSKYVPN
jgi:exosortase D (VPLPA-CTERM-specific)